MRNSVTIKQFKSELEEVEAINLKLTFTKKGKTIIGQLNLMQKYIVFRMMYDKFLINTSGTGTGKTISALAVAKLLGLRILVITNNSGKDAYYKDAKVVGLKTDSNGKYEGIDGQMIVINYDKFSHQSCLMDAIDMCMSFDPSFVVLDEVHNVKLRDDVAGEQSARRKQIMGLLSMLNYDKLMIQTATPVVNHISETESLIKIGNPSYDTTGLSIIQRKIKAYGELINCSVGFAKKGMKGGDKFNVIEYKRNKSRRKISSKRQYDILNLDVKFGAMSSEIKKGTLIYSDDTTGLVPKIISMVEDMNFTCGQYSGDIKDKNFGDFDVMVITSAASTGTDGMQEHFNRLIFFSLPPTWAEVEQTVGRIDRQGSLFDEVSIFVLMDKGPTVSWSEQKGWFTVQKKKIDSDLIRDGELSKENTIVNRKKVIKHLETSK